MRFTATLRFAALLLVIPMTTVAAQNTAATQPSGAAGSMEKVTGIGGVFFRAKDNKALAEWYERNLGVTRTPTTYGKEPWQQEAGPTVFAPFAADTKYFGNLEKQWMINFRVRNLDAMVVQLRAAGITVEVDPETYPNGRFAHLKDPEGNPIELWEDKHSTLRSFK